MDEKKFFSVISLVVFIVLFAFGGEKTRASVTDSINVPLEKIDTIAVSAEALINDSVSCDSIVSDSLVNDSLALDTVSPAEARLAKFRAAEYDMLCLIAHCEGVKARAYWDPHGRVWTIGFGNTVRPDGKPVRRGDRIKSEEELMHYFTTHIEGKMFEDMTVYLEMDSMSNAEIVAMGSFLYNCGSGILRQKDGSPSELANAANAYFVTHSDEAKQTLKKLMDQKVRSGGKILPQLQKRRDLEERVMFGDILLDNNGELSLENAINFAECALGGIYSMGRNLPADTLDLCNRLENMRGQNLNDSIQSQLRYVPRYVPRKSRR